MQSEIKVIEYWRRKYLGQAVIVFVLAAVVVWRGCHSADYFWLQLLLGIVGWLVVYLMIRELREDLQNRAESLIISNTENVAHDLVFDVGRGVDENILIKQNVVPAYQVRECRNVMHGKGFSWEENWFYSVLSFRRLNFNQDAFEGIVACFNMPKAQGAAEGKFEQIGQKVIVSGSVSQFLKKNNVEKGLAEMLQLFHTKEINVRLLEGKVYFWIKTDKRLFYQFSLLKMNSIMPFIRRINALKNLSDNLVVDLNS